MLLAVAIAVAVEDAEVAGGVEVVEVVEVVGGAEVVDMVEVVLVVVDDEVGGRVGAGVATPILFGISVGSVMPVRRRTKVLVMEEREKKKGRRSEGRRHTLQQRDSLVEVVKNRVVVHTEC